LSYFATLGYNETLFTKNLLLYSTSSNQFNNYDIVWQDIKSTLSTYDVAVDFAIADGDSAMNYMAFVLRNDWDTPKCILIDCEKKIRNSYNVNTIWQAIIDSANIQPNDNIYFAPDGVLCDIPIEYLLLPNGKPMNEVYNMYRLSSTRELCFRDTTQTYQTATLYGGLFYDTDSTTIVTESEKYKSTNRDINMMDNSIISQWRANDRANYQYLPYSKIEVNDICAILKGKTIATKVYTETSGNEESFKALSGNAPDILHIATHGYYITPLDVEVASKIALQRMGINIDERHNIIDYSMERTGLLLASATLKLQHDIQIKGVEDGILSAKEISTLDLSHVDLAVLSACKTGLGDITSDGVAGLQRGFKCAGVNSILMTLWEVDDAATHLFMSQFYKNLMNGKSKHESLQNAQKFLKEYKQDGEYIYDDYHYWAAFVLLDGI
jgi:CHAT domain-containing protein